MPSPSNTTCLWTWCKNWDASDSQKHARPSVYFLWHVHKNAKSRLRRTQQKKEHQFRMGVQPFAPHWRWPWPSWAIQNTINHIDWSTRLPCIASSKCSRSESFLTNKLSWGIHSYHRHQSQNSISCKWLSQTHLSTKTTGNHSEFIPDAMKGWKILWNAGVQIIWNIHFSRI